MFHLELVDFGAFTPEENAVQLYGVGGAKSLFLAANGWSRLSRKLWIAVGNIQVALRELPRVWMGPAATAMARAGGQYLIWLRDTIGRVEVTAAQIKRIALAYDAAQRAMVPADTCACLRADIDLLIKQNQFERNTAQIADGEVLYQKYWATNAQVMKDYAKEASAALALMTPFAQAPQINNGTKQNASCVTQ